MSNPTGVLLINLGTPNAPNKRSVRQYLREFLNDPRVVDIHPIARWILLNLFILPFRPKQTSEAYQQIWTPEGSPLLIFSNQVVEKVQEKLGEEYRVVLGMRYGLPTIESALTMLKQQHCQKIIILPLFPQYSSAATGSAIEKALSIIHRWKQIPSIEIISDFYQHPLFIQAYKTIIQQNIDTFKPDVILFSYHGLPVRHINSTLCQQSQCDIAVSCPTQQINNRHCYRQQCFTTTQLLATALGLSKNQYQTAFQSRLGKTPWISPYTDQLLPELAKQGVKRLMVACPSFVADCLETLEEIGIRAKTQWHALGGSEFKLIPCLNVNEHWITAIEGLVKEKN